jgi:hypothetical protein
VFFDTHLKVKASNASVAFGYDYLFHSISPARSQPSAGPVSSCRVMIVLLYPNIISMNLTKSISLDSSDVQEQGADGIQ